MKFDNINKILLTKPEQKILRAMMIIWFSLIWTSYSYSSIQIEVDTAVFMREFTELQELIVNPGKEKYTKKNNPAVELIEKIRNNKKNGDPRLNDAYSYDQYDKITLGLLDVNDEQLSHHEFLKDYIDTTKYGSRPVLNVFLSDKASENHYSKGKHKTIMTGQSSSGINEMFDAADIGMMLEDLMREVDIYENDITLMSNKFPSPLSTIGPDYYKYYISDTLDISGTRCIQVTFTPRNPESFSFMGNLYVELGDSNGFIKKVSMKVPRTINLNYVDNLYIDQTFEKDSLGKRHKLTDELNLDLCIVKGTQPLFSHRKSVYRNFSYEKGDYFNSNSGINDQATMENSKAFDPESFFSRMRGENLTKAEANMDTFMPRLREIPFFYWAEKALVILVGGYVKTGKKSKFDFGPVNTLISTNPIEGVRLRVGGMTTANLSPNIFASGYVAYGTKDRKWKYKGVLEYSLNKKKYHSLEFPINSIRATYMYDIDMIGQHYHFTNPDNVFLSLKRLSDKFATYRRLARLEYNIELASKLSFCVWGEHITQYATQWLPFTNGYGQNFSHYGRTSLGFAVRYAPGEKFIQEKGTRVPVNGNAPIIRLSQEWGGKCLPGADYSLCKTELSVQNRFWFSSFGYLDAIIKCGVIWTQVPYTELLWPNANLSYTIQPESYSLMNPMEFAMDKYASCDLTYWGNGVLFNRIPYVKKAKLREVIGLKGILGRLSDKNNPSLNPELYRFPVDCHAQTMWKRPYIEASAGIDNIFTILRVDYVWRLTFRDIPGIDRSGIRVSLHFNF